MAIKGIVRNGVIVPEFPEQLPAEGTRVTISTASIATQPSELPTSEDDEKLTFGDYFREFIVDAPGVPTDLAEQHDHYRLGTPKR